MEDQDQRRHLVYRDVATLIPSARNARTHSDEQVAQIAGSIREFGFLNPIVIDDANGIIAGHGRVLAARKLGLPQVPCIEAGHLTEPQRRAYMLADNKLTLNAGWDEALLKIELSDLHAQGFDLGLTGFGESELHKLLEHFNPTGADPEALPELPLNPTARLGDLWLLGRHRLACGDATDGEAVKQLFGDVLPHMMVTDPPYGVDYDPTWRHRAGVNKSKRVGKVKNDERADWREAWAHFPGDVAYVWHGGLHSSEVQASLEASGFEIRSQVVWVKGRFAISRGHYHWQHEPCWYAVRKGQTGHWAGDRKQTTVWTIEARNQDADTQHSTQKPVECMRRPIENNSSQGQAIYDPFLGSGTTLIACEQTGRYCYGVELNPIYCDMAILRWQKFSGLQATLASDGRPFLAVQQERAAPAQEPS